MIRSMNWSGCGVGRRVVLLLATGFGLGLSPVASGTAGTLPGIALVWLLAWISPGPVASAAVAAALALIAVPICGAAERHFGKKDDGRVVADEYLTFPICLLGLPAEPWVIAMAFLTARVFDVIKPPPARGAQELPGGWGIVADDVLSSLYALAVNHAVYAGARYLL